ncbi:MAG: hypothetical protein FWC77_03280 [Defluviitaleaceae bacterium]|nr:hypothetical protein [Defluviitaleaceae bacterium]
MLKFLNILLHFVLWRDMVFLSKERGGLMELKVSHGEMIVKFNEGILQGMTVRFGGEPCIGNLLSIYTWSGKVIEPVERKLTGEEIEFVKKSVLEYCEANSLKRQVEFN